MKANLGVFAAVLAAAVVAILGYYLLVVTPGQARARLALEQEKLRLSQETQKQKANAESTAQGQKAAFLSQCRDQAQQSYDTYVRLNGSENPDRPGVYTAPQEVWDKAESDRQAAIDECLRLAQAGIYKLPEVVGSPAAQTPQVVAQKPTPAAPPPQTFNDPTAATLSEAEVADFVDRYLGQTGSVESAMQLYADRVSYYDRGLVDREFIYNDKRAYFTRWPVHRYARTSDIATLGGTTNTREVRFDFTYTVSNGTRTLSGRGYAILGLQKFGEQILISEERGGIYK